MSFLRQYPLSSGLYNRFARQPGQGSTGLVPLVLSLVLALLAPHHSFAQSPQWESIGDGLAVSVWQPRERCPDIDSLLVVDADPERYRFSVHHYAQEGFAYPPTIEEWQKRTHHEVVFNAGLFRENFAYLGLLLKDGRSLGSRRHPAWHGLFVAEPADRATRPNARILDLTIDPFHEEAPSYREAAQSLMLLDRTGTIRVRQTGKLAYQTLVAESRNGHILVFKSRGLVSLHGIGQCLRDAFPSIRVAMAMDGGSSSDLLVSDALWAEGTSSPQQTSWRDLFAGTSHPHIPLPAVIGLSHRERPASSSGQGPKH